MLIRNDQIKVFADIKRQVFVMDQLQWIKEKYPHYTEGVDDDQIAQKISDLISFFGNYRVKKMIDLERLIRLSITHNYDVAKFKESKHILAIFSFPGRSADDIFFNLFKYLTSEHT